MRRTKKYKKSSVSRKVKVQETDLGYEMDEKIDSYLPRIILNKKGNDCRDDNNYRKSVSTDTVVVKEGFIVIDTKFKDTYTIRILKIVRFENSYAHCQILSEYCNNHWSDFGVYLTYENKANEILKLIKNQNTREFLYQEA